MTCGLENGIRLKFLMSELEVRPYDVDIRSRRRHYSHAEFKLSEKAGKLVVERSLEAEPVNILFDDNISRRMFVPEEAVKFNRDLDGNVKATLELHDPIKVLERGNISKSFSSVSLRRAVNHVLGHRSDPNSVITDIKFIDESDADEHREDIVDAAVDLQQFALPGSNNPASEAGARKVAEIFNGELVGIANWIDSHTKFYNGSDALYAGFDWDGVSPLAAFSEIMAEFELHWWVDKFGRLIIGPDATFGQVVGTTYGRNELALSRYSVTTPGNVTNAVQIRGPYNTVKRAEDEPGIYDQLEPAQYQLIAEARDTSLSGAPLQLETKTMTSPDELEEAALRGLHGEVSSDVAGSLAINGLASTNVSAIAELDVGDHLLVHESIASNCNENVITGHFLVHSVQHRANSRNGWKVEVEVTRSVNPSDVEVTSFLYDPLNDERYDDIDTLNETTELQRQDYFEVQFREELEDIVSGSSVGDAIEQIFG